MRGLDRVFLAGVALWVSGLAPWSHGNTFVSGDLNQSVSVSYDSGIILKSVDGRVERVTGLPPVEKKDKAIATIRIPDWAEETQGELGLQSFSVQHGIPDVDQPLEDISLTHRYRVPISEITFAQGQSFVGLQGIRGWDQYFLKTFGYGFRVMESDDLSFDLVPGLGKAYSHTGSQQEESGWMGNVNQQLTWSLGDDFALRQRLNTFWERHADDSMTAVVNLDVETILTEAVTFRVSYEVLYDDWQSDEFERRDRRLSTSVGFRF